jgi:hypothetical protein
MFLFCALLNFFRSMEKKQELYNDDEQLSRDWYQICDALFGDNFVQRDVEKALHLASACSHPDAVWLTKMFAQRTTRISSPEEARQVFLLYETDAKALCFGSLICGDINLPILKRAAELGFPFAQGRMARETQGFKEEKKAIFFFVKSLRERQRAIVLGTKSYR